MTGRDFTTEDRAHAIFLRDTLEPCHADLFPEETNRKMIGELKHFPLGHLLYQQSLDLDDVTLWYDTKRSEYFSASINQVLDLYAKHLDAKARAEQKQKIRNLYWGHRTKGVTA